VEEAAGAAGQALLLGEHPAGYLVPAGQEDAVHLH